MQVVVSVINELKPRQNNCMSMIFKYIPNILTSFRLLLIIPFVLFLFNHEYTKAFYIFILAGLTDGLDGWLARYFHWQSFFGSFLDPLADKLLVAASFVSLALLGSLPWWLVALVFLRDFTISMGVVAWYWFIQRKLDFEPTFLSKLNTTLQLMLVTLCLFELAYFKFPAALITSLIYLTTITTTITYGHYLWIGCTKAWPKKELTQ
jgi:cardiolipin synthase